MAYSYVKTDSPWKRAAQQKSQPTAFSGRCEEITAPTAEKATTRIAMVSMPSSIRISPGVRPLRRASSRVPVAKTTPNRPRIPASQAARRLIPPAPRLCSLAPSVTMPLYSTTDSQALPQPLRGGVGRTSENSPSTHSFSRWTWVRAYHCCCLREATTHLSGGHPGGHFSALLYHGLLARLAQDRPR